MNEKVWFVDAFDRQTSAHPLNSYGPSSEVEVVRHVVNLMQTKTGIEKIVVTKSTLGLNPYQSDPHAL